MKKGDTPGINKGLSSRAFSKQGLIIVCLTLFLGGSILFGREAIARAAFAGGISKDKVCSLQGQTQAMLSSHAGDVAREQDAPFYHLSVKTDITSLKYQGHEQLCFTNSTGASLQDIVMRLYSNRIGGSLKISNLLVDGKSATWKQDAKDASYLTITLASPITAKARSLIELDYAGTFSNKLGNVPNGFADGRQQYVDGVLVLGNFYPQLGVWEARKGWSRTYLDPAASDPTYADASQFNVEVTVPGKQKVFATGVEAQSRKNADGTMLHRFVTGPIREFAITMGEQYKVLSKQVDGITLQSIYIPNENGNALKHAQKTLMTGEAALRSFSHFFGAYPYRKIDYIEAPQSDASSGNELPTLLLFRADLYQTPPSVLEDGVPNTENYDGLVAHETAHMWWYNMVGNDQQGRTWIDEGTTNYSEVIQAELFARLQGKSPAIVNGLRKDLEDQLTHQTVLDYNSIGHDVVVNQPAYKLVESTGPLLKYNVPSYAAYEKTPEMYIAYRNKYGDTVFFQYLHNLFVDFQYKIAQPDDILHELQKAAPGHDQEIANFFKRWLNETHLPQDLDTHLEPMIAPDWYRDLPRYPALQTLDLQGSLAIFNDPTQNYIEANVAAVPLKTVIAFYDQKLRATGWKTEQSEGANDLGDKTLTLDATRGEQHLSVQAMPGKVLSEYRPDLASKIKSGQNLFVLTAS